MMTAMGSWLNALLGPGQQAANTSDTDAIRAIARRLDELPPDRARFVAAFAFVLSRVAHADLEISEAETRRMEDVVAEVGGLPAELAVLVVQIAKTQQLLFGGTENFLVTSKFAAQASREDKERLLHGLFAVSAADRDITLAEENVIRRIATELGFEHRDFSRIRSAYNDARRVLRDLPGGERGDG
jgi:uncharacterized tellurite resistance protein B-like protein